MDYVSFLCLIPILLPFLDVCTDGKQRRRAGARCTTTNNGVTGRAKESGHFVVQNDAKVRNF